MDQQRAFLPRAPEQFIVDIALKLKSETFPQSEEIVMWDDLHKVVHRGAGVVGGKGRVFTSGKVFGEEVLGGEQAAFTREP